MNSTFIPREKADFVINFSHNGEDVEITGVGAVELEQDYSYLANRTEATVTLNHVEGFKLKSTKKKPKVEFTARVTVDEITPENVEKARRAAGVSPQTPFRVTPNWAEAAIKMPSDTYTIEFRWSK